MAQPQGIKIGNRKPLKLGRKLGRLGFGRKIKERYEK
jgi:hypothetical protein